MVAPRLTRQTYSVPAQAVAGTDEPTVLGTVAYTATISKVTFTPEANITGVATNNRRFSLINKGQDGNGAVEVAALEMAAGVNAFDFDELTLTLSVTPANLAANVGDVLAWLSDAQGTGLADPGGTVTVEYGPQGAAS
jgi:hypothetical protein